MGRARIAVTPSSPLFFASRAAPLDAERSGGKAEKSNWSSLRMHKKFPSISNRGQRVSPSRARTPSAALFHIRLNPFWLVASRSNNKTTEKSIAPERKREELCSC